jgi:hypothetical protein
MALLYKYNPRLANITMKPVHTVKIAPQLHISVYAMFPKHMKLDSLKELSRINGPKR